MSFHEFLDTLIAFFTAIGLFWAILKFAGVGFFKPLFAFFHDIVDIVNTQKEIKRQILPNGGSSISDTVKRIELRQCLADGMDRAILTKINAILFESSSEGKYLAVSKPYCDFVGKQREDLLDNGWINCIADEDKERVWEAWAHAIEQRREYIDNYKMIDKDGKAIPVSCRTFLVLGPKLEIIRYIGLIEKTHEKNM